MSKLIVLFLLVPFTVNAQENYKWLELTEVKFYDLISSGCKVDSFPATSRYVTLQTSQWGNILIGTGTHNALIDVANENTCYLILVGFKNGESIPFLLYPEQRALFDLRKNHFNYLFFKDDDGIKMNQLMQDAIGCLKDPACKTVN